MINISLLFVLSFLFNPIHTSVTFIVNPNCNITQCTEIDEAAFYYGNQTTDDKTNHMIYSSFDELTISIFQTSKTSSPTFDYAALYAKNYTKAMEYTGGKPTNSLTLVIRRLIEFNDSTDKDALMNGDPNTTKSYFLSNLTRSNITFGETGQPAFQYQIEELGGLLTIDIVYPGATIRDTKFPKLRTEPSSYFLNIALKATNYSFISSRFAFELYLISPGTKGFTTKKSRFIDDQYTPGSFNVWELKSNPESSDLAYPSSMLWKPVVYLTDERSVEDNTLMQVYALQNNVTRDPEIDQGMFLSLLPQPTISAMNVSIGSGGDGFFKKDNFGFLQFTAGLDDLKPDATAGFVTVAVVVSFALPILVGIVAAIFILRRRFSKQPSRLAYNEINT